MKSVRSYTYALPNGEHFAAVEDVNAGRRGRYTLFCWHAYVPGAEILGIEVSMVDVRRIITCREREKRGYTDEAL